MATGVDAKLLKSTKFPPEFNQKVDMQKVNIQVMKKWIASTVTTILGNEDDVVIELIFNLIEGGRFPDIKSLQIQLTGFLDKDTATFCKDLWKLLLSAQSSPQGVPKELLEAKKQELLQEKLIKLLKRLDRGAKNSSAATVAEVGEEVEGEATLGVDVVMIVIEVASVAAVVGLALHPAIVTVVEIGEIEGTAEAFVGV
ncbi:PWI domain-containing protein [Lasiosphaeris hirsuta]|uniref:PWI domain-containing protein n=1 Tax=Lasiosphaeris hirsuta TaxID=260670 RepID=A0AA40E7L7_9PEZI|nr:PWI domain-containing protein [Lasiosphaeris hirsuta]